MGLFNFIETFFFISLGITFVLILLLVYHFKQRLSSLENKCDTMFEIINNVVQEITIVRGATNRIMQEIPNVTMQPVMSYVQEKVESIEQEEDDDEDEDDEDDEDNYPTFDEGDE